MKRPSRSVSFLEGSWRDQTQHRKSHPISLSPSYHDMKDIVVLYPSAFKGHFVSMVELGKRLLDHHSPPPFSVTIIISLPPHEADFAAAYISTVSTTHPEISFLHLPPPSDNIPSDFFSPVNFLCSSFDYVRLNNTALHTSLSSISKSGNSTIRALVLDFFCTASFHIGAGLSIPVYYFYTSGASGLAQFLNLPTIHGNLPKSFKDLDPDTIIDIPGVPPTKSRDLPEPISDRSSRTYRWFLETARDMAQAAGLIMNTFHSFEVSAMKALRDGLCVTDGPTPPTFCVGPVVVTENKDGEDDNRHECLRWLDLQPSRSVVLLSFGSMGKFSTKQLNEMALGLERSGVRFLWVVRLPPPEDEGRRAIPQPEPSIELFLPDGFLERTKERGFVVESWAPQVAVLNHGSVGGFVTHCGWNSVLEAVCAGVPMLAWPLYAEQRMNRNYIVEESRVALALKESEEGFVRARELEERIIELMSTEKGERVRKQVLVMKEEAAAALMEGGSSSSALAELIRTIMQGRGKPGGSDPAELSGGIERPNPVAISTET